MQQLSGSDTGFLYAEQGNNYNHVAMLAIYDPSTAVDGNADGGPLIAARLMAAPYASRIFLPTSRNACM